jgi:hypothetical protein
MNTDNSSQQSTEWSTVSSILASKLPNAQFANINQMDISTENLHEIFTEAETNPTVYAKSFFIPHVHNYIGLSDLASIINNMQEVMEIHDSNNKMCRIPFYIGKVGRIEAIPKTNQKDGHLYYSCFVYMNEWYDNPYTKDIVYKLNTKQSIRVYYKMAFKEASEYIVLLPNTSFISQLEPPLHMDLTLYLHTDVCLETVLSIIEGLDIGKVCRVDAELCMPNYETSNDDTNEFENNCWKYTNVTIWKQKVKPIYNRVHIRFEFWYKTKTAYLFQSDLKSKKSLTIPVMEGVNWTFYKSDPFYYSYNPFIYIVPEINE